MLNRLFLGEEHTLIPAALTLTRAHNLRGSWVAVQFHLDFIDDAMLIGASALSALLTLSLYRYYLKQRQQPSLWAGLALVRFVAGLSSAFIDLAIRGFTVDYLGVAGLVVADLKDLYLDVALAAFFAELAENFGAMRRMSNRQMIVHLKRALELTRQEIKALLLRRGSRSTL